MTQFIKINRPKGEKAATWKGGVCSKNEIARKSLISIEWRKSIYRRDNYLCQDCSKKGGVLHAHHIKPFSTYHEARFDINNGITLCEKCHKKRHNWKKYQWQLEGSWLN